MRPTGNDLKLKIHSMKDEPRICEPSEPSEVSWYNLQEVWLNCDCNEESLNQIIWRKDVPTCSSKEWKEGDRKKNRIAVLRPVPGREEVRDFCHCLTVHHCVGLGGEKQNRALEIGCLGIPILPLLIRHLTLDKSLKVTSTLWAPSCLS